METADPTDILPPESPALSYQLKEVAFKEVKGFGVSKDPDGFFRIEPAKKITVLVGKNGTGKSTVLEILRYLTLAHDSQLGLGIGFSSRFTQRCVKRSIYGPYRENSEVKIKLRTSTIDELDYCFQARLVDLAPFKSPEKAVTEQVSKGIPLETGTSTGFTNVGPRQKNFYSAHSVDTKDCIYLRDLRHHSAPSYLSPTDLESFLVEQNESIGAFRENGNWFVSYTKDKVYELFNRFFEIDLRYDRLGKPYGYEEVEVVNGKATYGFWAESTGIRWVLRVISAAIQRQGTYLAIDEPECYLHPDFQSRLYRCLASLDLQTIVCTHSALWIDHALKDDDSKVIHFEKIDSENIFSEVKSPPESLPILDGLGVKASHILQVNGIIWVEGATDCIYLRKWLELYCVEAGVPQFVEGRDYAFLCYGGKCLSHVHFENLTEKKLKKADLLYATNAFRISRNKYLVLDSDRKCKADEKKKLSRSKAKDLAMNNFPI